jgi:hypothetical protein
MLLNIASGGGTVVKHSYHHITVEGSSQAWSNLETANESETRCLHSSTACPIFNELVNSTNLTGNSGC